MKWLKRLAFWRSGDRIASIREKLSRAYEEADIPSASFEVNGFEPDGRVKVNFTWNQPFIKKIKALGFEAETDEDTVQLFFFASSLRPTQLAADPSDDPIQSLEHPQLSSIDNELRV